MRIKAFVIKINTNKNYYYYTTAGYAVSVAWGRPGGDKNKRAIKGAARTAID